MVGNSIVRYLNIENVEQICLPGKTLSDMKEELKRDGVKIVICGIPDIMPDRDATRVCGELVSAFERELTRASDQPGVILCPFYPPRALAHRQWGIVHRLNMLICELNSKKGRGTPPVVSNVFGRSRTGGLYFSEHRLRDNAHPSQELAGCMSAAITRFIENCRNEAPDLRRVLERLQEDRQDRQGNQKEERRQPEVERRVVTAAEDGLDLDKREREMIQAAMAERTQREEEAKERYEREMDRIARRYVGRLDEAREERERRTSGRQEERQERETREAEQDRRRRKDRERREERDETERTKGRDVRRDVPVHRDFA